VPGDLEETTVKAAGADVIYELLLRHGVATIACYYLSTVY
jgi:hypothetical protein